MGQRLDGRNGEIWFRYCRGETQEALGEAFGISQRRVSQIIEAVRKSIGPEERTDLIQEEVDLFRRLRSQVLSEIWDAEAGFVPVGKDGELMRDPTTGKWVRDHGGRLAALAAAERLSARMHKLLGLEAATKLIVDDGEKAAAERQGAEAASYLHGGEDAE
jgi:DNA-binding transcriptional regulator LsrR (DeoR family)